MSQRLERIAIVGGGLAGLRAVETLRRGGFDGWIGLIGDEAELPYDRPPLSKEVLTQPDVPPGTTFRGAESLMRQGVEVRLGSPALGLDLRSGTIRLRDEALPFDGLIIATGATPRQIPALAGLEHVHTLRTQTDALAVRDELEHAEHLIVVGAGFIGAEVAASARARGVDVTIVEMDGAPLARVLGSELGAATVDLHREHGTRLLVGMAVVDGYQAPDGTVRLLLSDGSTLEGDLVVVGVGVEPNTNWLAGSGLQLDNGVVCSAALSAGRPGVFAVGDVASWPNPLFGRRMRVEHWTNAAAQARHAARNLLDGSARPFEGSNYFWSDQYGVRIQFAGVVTADAHRVTGRVDDRRFVMWFSQDDRLVGAFAMACPELFMASKRLIEERADWRVALSGLSEHAAPSSLTT